MDVVVTAARPRPRKPCQWYVDVILDGRPYRDLLAISRRRGVTILEPRDRRGKRYYTFSGSEKAAVAAAIAEHVDTTQSTAA